MKLILGTVQMGKLYGKFMKNKIEDNEIDVILNYCLKNNICTFDTAQNYGNSEQILSKISNKNNVKIIDKIDSVENILGSFEKSIVNLNSKNIDTLMFHNFENIKILDYREVLIGLKNNKKINNIGVSVYNVEEAIYSLKLNCVTVIQIPFNYLDRQWENNQFLNLIKNRPDVEIHIRSIFLQGLLLNDVSYWPNECKNIYEKITKICNKYNLTKLELVIIYSLSFKWISGILFGIDNINHLIDTHSNFKKMEDKLKKEKSLIFNLIEDIKNEFWNVPNNLIDPRLWK